jgi:hypothetical protein
MVPFLRLECVIGTTSIGPKCGSRRFNVTDVGVGRTSECGGGSLVGSATFSGVSCSLIAVSGLPRGSTDSEVGCDAAEGTAILEDLRVGASIDAGATGVREMDVREVVVQESIAGSFGGIVVNCS